KRPPELAAQPLRIDVAEVVVRDGAMKWRDETVKPTAMLDLSGIDTRITGVSWPLQGPLGVRAGVRPPGGGHISAVGRVGIDPLTADLRVTAKDADLAPYQPYVPMSARIGGRADLDVAVTLPSIADVSDLRGSVRGRAGLTRLDVRDGERTVTRIER